jgi:hypothetical protein
MAVSELNFWLAYVLTLVTIVAKLALSGFLFKKYRDIETPANQKINFIMAVLLLMLGLAISRICFFVFDFYMTHYDSSQVYVYPNIIMWKVGMFISMLSGVPIVYVVERDIYQFKTKKIPTIVVGSLSVASLVYPVHNNFDFNIISAIVSVAMLVSIIIPVGFIYLATKTTGQIRRVCIMISLAIVFYGIGSIFITDGVLTFMEQTIHPEIRTPMIIIVPILKILSLITASYATVNFRI